VRSTGLDGFFRDKNGNIVIVQPPNLPIYIWSIASAFKLLFPTGAINGGLDLVATISLFIWSVAELFQGDSYFRRTLGALVLMGMIISKLTHL
jgi:hypothetical protein